ncbi:MAG: gluconokinase [Chloroflexota bacterium]
MSSRSDSILALDLGTSSFRAAIFGARAQMVRGTGVQVPCTPDQPEPGASEHNAKRLAEAVETLIDSAVSAASTAVIGAIGMSCFWHSLVGVDGAGHPLTPVYLWSDLRSASDAAMLRLELDEHEVYRRTGAALHPTFWTAKLRWMARTRPHVAQRVRHWLSFADYLRLRWLGETCSSLSMASATGLFDQHRQQWDTALLGAVGVDPSTFPPIIDLGKRGPTLRPRYAQRWPNLIRALWLPAIGDGACSNVGVAALGPKHWAITVGTSAAVRVVLETSALDLPWGLWQYRLDSERAVIGGALNNGGNVYAWLRRTLRLPSQAAIEHALLTRPWGVHGLSVDPSLAGERSPDWPLNATGWISGITQATEPIDITQAMLEAVAERIGSIAALLETAVGAPEEIVTTGGAMLRSRAWANMLASALGRPVTPSPIREGSLRGAALLAIEQTDRSQG